MHKFLGNTIISKLPTEPQPGDVGVELEIEGRNLPVRINGWNTKEEQSLRGEAREYVTSGAVTMDELAVRMRRLNTALTSENVAVNLTPRASTHIHVNMQRETFRTFFGFLMMYATIEPLLLRLCGPHRNGNLFCLPVHESADIPYTVNQWVKQIENYGNTRDFGRHSWKPRGKYSALNTDPLTMFGSVEVRAFPNSIDPGEVTRWASWLVQLRTLARDWNTEDYSDFHDTMYFQPQRLLALFMNHPGYFQMGGLATHLIRVGLENSYEIYRAAHKLLSHEEKSRNRKKVVTTKEVPDVWIDAEDPVDALQRAAGGRRRGFLGRPPERRNDAALFDWNEVVLPRLEEEQRMLRFGENRNPQPIEEA